MEPNEFRHWRKSLGWKQKEAAERLGLKKRVIQYYEKGHRDGKTVAIPTSVELACLALALGHEAFDGAIADQAIATRARAAAEARSEEAGRGESPSSGEGPTSEQPHEAHSG